MSWLGEAGLLLLALLWQVLVCLPHAGALGLRVKRPPAAHRPPHRVGQIVEDCTEALTAVMLPVVPVQPSTMLTWQWVTVLLCPCIWDGCALRRGPCAGVLVHAWSLRLTLATAHATRPRGHKSPRHYTVRRGDLHWTADTHLADTANVRAVGCLPVPCLPGTSTSRVLAVNIYMWFHCRVLMLLIQAGRVYRPSTAALVCWSAALCFASCCTSCWMVLTQYSKSCC